MSKKQILIINRWDDELAHYFKYIDHRTERVHYIVNDIGFTPLTKFFVPCASIHYVPDLNKAEHIFEATQKIVSKVGSLDKIIAMSEFDLITAANLRSYFQIPGMQANEVLRFRDKIVMKEALQETDIPCAKFWECEDPKLIEEIKRKARFPLVLKPRREAASRGVVILNNFKELEIELKKIKREDYEIEEFIEGPICHADGFVAGSKLKFARISKYVNTCLDYAHGLPLGSFILDDKEETERLSHFIEKVVWALQLNNSPFHLEFILGKNGRPVFLEIGARIGGGEIPFVFKDIYGVDLVEEWIHCELGVPVQRQYKNQDIIGGFLLIPEPKDVPCRVLATPELQKNIPEIYWEGLPQRGDILDGNGLYDKISGRFRYKAGTSKEVSDAILRSMHQFYIHYEPVEKLAA